MTFSTEGSKYDRASDSFFRKILNQIKPTVD